MNMENVMVPFLIQGIDFYNEHAATKLQYKFDIQEMVDDDPETQLRNLRSEMHETVSDLKKKNAGEREEMSGWNRSMETKLMISQIMIVVLLVVVIVSFWYK
jgi:hypothetical protein